MDETNTGALADLGDSRAGEIHCVTIIGQIEGHVVLPADTKSTKYEHIMPLLAAIEESEEIHGADSILDRPLHDTGSIWLGILSFFLSLLGLIGAVIFRKFNYIKNYKVTLRGSLAGLAVKCGIILLFLIFLFIAAH